MAASDTSRSADLPFASATELAKRISDREISCEEALNLYLSRIDQYNGELNAIVVDIREQALEEARAADRKLADGAAVDSLVYDQVVIPGSRYHGKLKVIEKSPGFPIPPVVAPRSVPADLRAKFRSS